MKKAVISCGGTGGHIFPAVAVARKLKGEFEVVFIGTRDGMEKEILEREGFRFIGIDSGKFYRRLTLKNFASVYRVLKGIFQSRKALKGEKPDIVVGFGGYVCAPVVFSARLCGIKAVLQEQNAVPGLANKWLSRSAVKVLVGFKSAERYFGKKAVYTGNPVREEIGIRSRLEGLRNLGLADGAKTVAVIGGSQGGRGLNKAVAEALPFLKGKNIRLVWMTGKNEYETYAGLAGKSGVESIVSPFFKNMEDVYAAADLIVARSGASTVFEVLKCGLPSILVPFPSAANNHQYYNALTVEEGGAGVVCEEKELTGGKLAGKILEMLGNETGLKAMAGKAKEMGRPDARAEIIKELKALI